MTPAKSPYALATARAAALYVPGHPTEEWRIACQEAQEAWEAQRGGAGDGARRLGVGKGSKR